ncbi:YlbF family regulator [Weissella diestrammenae]|uniref:UPF0342 protein H9L19_06155 n=1 Tax=Weissella diestrammenae TaxID=1162633 RepID=A0A7G9T4E4_9LACO|nr:YlbF family regulator [Weissella diestrammenae]MCM0583505.1 YlbF family regulator [Weissella diestrammenae]QNN74969.1 YlbF family regulator [Weissella diestrammenae]
MINIYDNVNGVASDLVETAQYKNLRDAVTAMHQDAEAEAVFTKFQTEQQAIQELVQTGAEPSAEQIESWQAVASEMEKHETLTALMQAESALNALLQEINAIITKPIAELYN